MESEIWKSIKGYEELYEVSTLGRVRRIHKDIRSSPYKILKLDTTHKGYKKVHLYKNNIGKPFNVHRLAAETFIPNPDNLPQINHIDENPSNNRVDNLEWCSMDYNIHYGTGIARQVEKRSKIVLCFDLDMNFLREYPSTAETARSLDLSQGCIVACCNGGYWRDNHTKFIRTNKVKQYIFKYKNETN